VHDDKKSGGEEKMDVSDTPSEVDDSPNSLGSMEIIIGGEAVTRKDRMDFGTVVHEVLEVLVKNIDNEKVLDATIAALDAQSEGKYTKQNLNSIADKFKGEELWQKLQNAKRDEVYTEVPFSFVIPKDEEFAGKKWEQDTYFDGVIDLVFKDGDKWIIADYKTHDAKIDESAVRKNPKYREQLAIYKAAWERLTGEAGSVSDTPIFPIAISRQTTADVAPD
jgi:ATP-dependent helicase/nuclease subunit A